ncbi:TIGR03089 family protein [Nakamurella sp. GG22]
MTTPSPAGGITAAVLGPLLAGDPHRPRLIWHGAGRTELSTATLANWSAKTAGFLIDELGAHPSDTVVWRVRRSWQGVPLLLGSWWAGMVVTDLYDRAAESEAAAAFIDEDDESGADEVIVASSHPFGVGKGALPEFYRHVSDAILPQADRFIPHRPGADADSVAVVTNDGSVTITELLDRTARAAEAIGPAGRVLSTVDLTLPDRVCSALLGALAADGSLIQVTHEAAADADALARIAADEGATVTFGVDVAGLPRLG